MTRVRVHEVAKQLGLSSTVVIDQLGKLGIDVPSASSMVDAAAVAKLREAVGQPAETAFAASTTDRQLGWNAGAVRAVTYPDTIANIERLKRGFSAAREHQEALAKLGSQYVFASECSIRSFEGCFTAFVRFSGAIETGFGLTREVLFFYSPHPDLQIRTYNAARQVLRDSPREITPDIMFFWSPDPRLREKLDDWSSGKFLPIPLDFTDDENPIAFISLLRDYIFARDLFYETTPVQGERFYGRRILLQNLRDDVRNQRVAGLFGLRKAGKTSVLSELARNMSDANTIVILRDLESLPSPPDDPVPDLLRDLTADFLDELRSRNLRTQPLNGLPPEYGIADFKRAVQNVLRKLSERDVNVVLMLDEIEYLTPSDRIDVQEGDMASVAQMLGALRSLVQENSNFTFVLSGLTSAIVESGRLYGRPNPLFSWAKAHFLAPFERAEADDLARSVGQKMGITLEGGALEALYQASGGHAFLYRHLASHVVGTLPADVFHRKMRRANVLGALGDWRLAIAGNMREMVDHVKRYYPDEAFLLDVLRDEPELFALMSRDEPLALGHLLNLGLVQRDGHSYELTPVLQL